MTTNAAEKRLPIHDDGREILTYSAISSFRNCARKFELRYQEELGTESQVEALYVGSIVHKVIEEFYNAAKTTCLPEKQLVAARVLRENLTAGHMGDPIAHARWHHITAMTESYFKRWCFGGPCPVGQITDAEFDVVSIEEKFFAPIINPETGAQSRTFCMAGMVDGVVRLAVDRRLYILERKTASSIDSGYLAKLWTDFQSMLYASYLSRIYKEQFAGVLYDIIGKRTRFEQKGGETQEEFDARLAEYKTEKTREKHIAIGPKQAETDEEFQARIRASYYDTVDAQHRELILFDPDRMAVIDEEIWDLTKQIMAARTRGRFGMNTSTCYSWGRGCDFVDVCRAGRLDDVTRIGLVHKPAHNELLNGAAEAEDPIF